MKIEFNFEMNDWMEFQKHYFRNSKQFRRTKIIVATSLPLIFCAIIIFELLKGEFRPVSIIVFGLVSLLWIIFYPKRMFNRTLDKTRKMIEEGDNTGILGRHELTLNDDGIIHVEPESEQKIKWSGIKKLEESDSYYFLYNTAVSAIVIPKQKVLNNIEQLDKILKSNIADI